LGYPTTYAYNSANELTSTTDADGRTIDYGYDAAGRKTSETWVNGNYTATYGYNADSELTSASDPFSSYTYTYDALGDVTNVDNAGTPGVPHVALSYGYDSFGNRTSLTDSLGGSISYAYNANNQLSSLGLSVSSTLDAQLTFGYDADSRLTGITRTGATGSDTITSSLSYDTTNRLTNITDTDTTKSTTLASYTYGYDAASRLTSYQDNSGNSLTYGYDKTNQLTSAAGTLNGSNYSVSYSYDTNGNRNMAGYQTTANELTNDGTYSYTYDNNGNMLTQTNIATGNVTYYTWDYRNRLTEVQVKDSNGNLLQDEKFTYDVNNNRIGVALNGTQQLWTVYDGSNPYMDFNGSGQLTQRYLTNPKGLSQFYGQVSASGVTQWFLTDNLSSIRQVVSTSGTSLDAITYDPYGNILSQTNAANTPRVGFAGGAVDSLTGNVQFDARPYRPVDGRFESEDPRSFAGGDVNLYRYTGNSPVNRIDPSGEDWRDTLWSTGQGVLGVVIIAGGVTVAAAGGWTGVGLVGGGVMTVYGADLLATGVDGLISGKNHRTYTGNLVAGVTGSETAGNSTDIALQVVLGGYSCYMLLPVRVGVPVGATGPAVAGRISLQNGQSVIGWIRNGRIVIQSAPNVSHKFLGQQAGIVDAAGRQIVADAQAFTVVKEGGQISVFGSLNFGGVLKISDEAIAILRSVFY
jgi:RHS repeat-associated protein